MKCNATILICLMLALNASSIAAQISGRVPKCFQVNNIFIRNDHLLHGEATKELLHKYKGKCLNLDKINNLVKEITNIYIEGGFITSRVEILPQDLQSKSLELEIKDGFVEDIEFTDKSNRAYDTAFGGMIGKRLNLRDIEQGFDNINSLRSNKAFIDLKPGKKEGSTIVVIKNTPKKRWSLATGLDNSGNKNKSVYQGFINSSIDNLLGLNDTVNINYKGALKLKYLNKQKVYSINTAIPIGYYNFSIFYEHGNSKQNLEISKQTVPYTEHHTKKGMNLIRTVQRSGQGKSEVNFGFYNSSYEEKTGNNKLKFKTYKLTVLETGISHSRRFLNGLLKLSLSYNRGLVSGDENDITFSPNFNKFIYEASWMKHLGSFAKDKDVYYSLTFKGQRSDQLLPQSEKLDLSNSGGVRGFKSISITSDNGFTIRNQIAVSIPKAKQVENLFGETQVFCGLDLGRFWRNDDTLPTIGKVSSIAAGVIGTGGNVNFNWTIAKALPWGNIIRPKGFSVYIGLSLEV